MDERRPWIGWLGLIMLHGGIILAGLFAKNRFDEVGELGLMISVLGALVWSGHALWWAGVSGVINSGSEFYEARRDTEPTYFRILHGTIAAFWFSGLLFLVSLVWLI